MRIIQRGNNRQPCFFAEEDYRFFLDHLAQLEGESAQHPVPSAQAK
jgi:putative transposase